MAPTTIIEMGFIISIVTIIGLLTFLIKRTYRKYVWGFLGLVLIVSISFYSIRPILVEKQTNNAIQQLDDYLESSYPNDSWEIYDTDDYELQSIKTLHIIFDTEPVLVYEYILTKDSVDQTGIWHRETGDVPDVLGIVPMHIE